MNRLVAALAAAGLAAFAGQAAAATQWTVDPGSRSLTWSVQFEHRQLPGLFADFSADIAFDPADLDGSSVTVTIPVEAIRTETPEMTAELTKPDWFAADDFPTATFTADSFRALGGDAYEADGTLTIRDAAVPVTLPFTFAIDGDRAAIAGGTTVDRLDFGVGQGDWALDDVIGFEVTIAFELTATRAQ